MCKVRGVRTYCACKDKACRNRREFQDLSAKAGVVLSEAGHGWQYIADEIEELCPKGEMLIKQGIMFWADAEHKKVVSVVAHHGLEVAWEYRWLNENGVGVLCDYCKRNNHSVTSEEVATVDMLLNMSK
ncbi:hypothetical protein G7046_g7289 [Stylonectria norvegica]|nr:hypothetical protein G7046_g7289 [Stylonectria norvegica]